MKEKKVGEREDEDKEEEEENEKEKEKFDLQVLLSSSQMQKYDQRQWFNHG